MNGKVFVYDDAANDLGLPTRLVPIVFLPMGSRNLLAVRANVDDDNIFARD